MPTAQEVFTQDKKIIPHPFAAKYTLLPLSSTAVVHPLKLKCQKKKKPSVTICLQILQANAI